MARTYRQSARRDASTETRAKVLEAARDLFAERGFVDVTIDDIARAAGVARATIYQHFGSKAGILDAQCERIVAAGLLQQVRDALRLPDPLEALDRGVRMGTAFWASDHDFFRGVYAVAAIEPGALRFVDLQRADHRSEMTSLVERIDTAGLLREGLTPADATERLVALTGFHFYDELATFGGLTSERTADAISDLAWALTRPTRVRPRPSRT